MFIKLNILRVFSILMFLVFTVSIGLVFPLAVFAMSDEGANSFGEQAALEEVPGAEVKSGLEENLKPNVTTGPQETPEPDKTANSEDSITSAEPENSEETDSVEPLCGDTAEGDGGSGGGCGGDEGTDHGSTGGCGGDEGTDHESGGCGGGSGGSGGQGGPGNEDAVPPNKGPLKLSNFTLSGERVVFWEMSQLADPAESTVLKIVQGSEGTASYTVEAQKECRKRFRGEVTVEVKPEPGVTAERIRLKLFIGETVISTVYLSESPIHFEKGFTDYEIDFELGPEGANQLPENISASIFFDGLDKGPQPRKKYISTSVSVPANRGDTILTGELRLSGEGIELLWLKVGGRDMSIDTSAAVDGYVYAATVHKEIYKNSVFRVETGFRGILTGNYYLSHMARFDENDPDNAVVNVRVYGTDYLPPKAVEDIFTIRGLSTRVIDVLANDIDYYGEGLTVTQAAYEEVTAGTVDISEDGKSLVYTPGGYGTDTFTYTVSDKNGGIDTVQVTINVLRQSSGSSGGDNNTGDEGVNEGATDNATGGQGEDNGTGGLITVPDTTGPAPGVNSSAQNAFGAGNMGVSVSPRRVPAGDPTIAVSIAGAVQVYAMLPDGRKLELEEVKPGYWKKSFLIPFGTPDGSYRIRVIAVDSAGVEREANYGITIDNTLPLIKVSQQAQDNGTYLLEAKPMFNALRIYYVYAGGEPVQFIAKGGIWTAEVPDVSGQVIGVDESGYVVRLDVPLAELTVETAGAAQSGLGWIGPDLAFRSAAVNGEVTGSGTGADNTVPAAVMLGLMGVILGVVLGKRYGYN